MRHAPDKSVPRGVNRGRLEATLARARNAGDGGYPRTVEHDFRRCLNCGLLCHGFALSLRRG